MSFEKIFVFKYLYTIFRFVFTWNRYGKSVTRTFLGRYFFGLPYHLNSTKIDLDAALSTNWISCNNLKKGKCKCMETAILWKRKTQMHGNCQVFIGNSWDVSEAFSLITEEYICAIYSAKKWNFQPWKSRNFY